MLLFWKVRKVQVRDCFWALMSLTAKVLPDMTGAEEEVLVVREGAVGGGACCDPSRWQPSPPGRRVRDFDGESSLGCKLAETDERQTSFPRGFLKQFYRGEELSFYFLLSQAAFPQPLELCKNLNINKKLMMETAQLRKNLLNMADGF